MKILLLIVASLVVSAVVLLFVLALVSRSGDLPGLVDGHLPACPNRPNCVCSECPADPDHLVEPLPLPHGVVDLESRIGMTLTRMGGEVRIERDNYVAATFSSPLFGFVDDFQVRVDPEGRQIHLRSASRVGYSDGGVNRKRATRFRAQWQALLATTESSGNYQ
ncbi:MAG: DUF1499 domain-containing protein [Sedimenticola sp.]|nr:DUF1499 domain-containing protein [Sedimenticola sp.]